MSTKSNDRIAEALEKLITMKMMQIAPKACKTIYSAIRKLEKYEALGIDVSTIKERLLTLAKQLKCETG